MSRRGMKRRGRPLRYQCPLSTNSPRSVSHFRALSSLRYFAKHMHDLQPSPRNVHILPKTWWGFILCGRSRPLLLGAIQ